MRRKTKPIFIFYERSEGVVRKPYTPSLEPYNKMKMKQRGGASCRPVGPENLPPFSLSEEEWVTFIDGTGNICP